MRDRWHVCPFGGNIAFHSKHHTLHRYILVVHPLDDICDSFCGGRTCSSSGHIRRQVDAIWQNSKSGHLRDYVYMVNRGMASVLDSMGACTCWDYRRYLSQTTLVYLSVYAGLQDNVHMGCHFGRHRSVVSCQSSETDSQWQIHGL